MRPDIEGGPPSTKAPAWIIADRIHHTGTAHPVAQGPLGGTTIRNAVIVSPDCAPGWGTGTRQFFRDTAGGTKGAGNTERRSELYSCANARSRNGITLNRNFDADGFAENTNPDTFKGNGIHHAANMADGAPLDLGPLGTTPRWSPVYDGERWRTEPVDTSRAYESEISATFAPTTGSLAIGGAIGKVSLLDMDGNLRSEVLAGLDRDTPSAAPYEPSLEN